MLRLDTQYDSNVRVADSDFRKGSKTIDKEHPRHITIERITITTHSKYDGELQSTPSCAGKAPQESDHGITIQGSTIHLNQLSISRLSSKPILKPTFEHR